MSYDEMVKSGDLVLNLGSGVSDAGLALSQGPSANQAAWMKYGAIVAAGAVVGLALDGRDGVLPGLLAGVAGVALFGDITWTG